MQNQKETGELKCQTDASYTADELQKIIELEETFKNYQGKDRVISSTEAEEEIKSEKENPISYVTGFPQLDRYIERIEGGEMIVVSGLTKNGKTTWCQSLTKNLFDYGVESLWFSFEMPTKQLLNKFPIGTRFYLPRVLYNKDLLWIENKIYEAKLKYKTNVVFIDHLHFIIDLMARNTSWEVGRVVREIKKIAVKHNVIIFLICHMRKTKLDEGGVPNIDDLRDSSFIAQDSDGVFFVTRMFTKNSHFEKEYQNETKLTIAVHRHSGTMEKNVLLKLNHNRFYEVNAVY